MLTSQRLSEDAVLEHVRPYSPSRAALAALQAGDAGALIRSHHGQNPGVKMMAKDDDDADEDDVDDDDDDSGEDDEDDSDDDDTDDEDDDDGPEGKKSKKTAKKKPEGDPQRKIAALEDEKNRLYRGRERARKERDDARGELERVKKEGAGDDQLKEQVSTLENTNQTLSEDLRSARMQIAFLSDNTYEWHDPGVALKSVSLKDLEIDDDGKVHGLTAALETLATDKPFLLKTTETKTTRKAPPRSSGTSSKRRPDAKKAAAKKAEIAQKYGIRR